MLSFIMLRSMLKIALFVCCFSLANSCLFLDAGGPADMELYTFCNTLRRLNDKPSDVVFVLDESGSIGIQNFPYEITFTEMIARMFSIAPDHTRVAVITFGTGNKFRFNYISENVEGNMCTFMKDLNNIDYSGGWTWTKEALEGAGELLKNARYNTQKIIVLITDGVHTTADPVPVAQELKNKGILIFSVGIADINKEEVHKVATSPEYVYMLEDFKENIKKINDDMRTDVRDLHWAAVKDSSKCKSTCDANAECFCGANSGDYQCACKPGFFGLGGQGECQPCPKGTYNTEHNAAMCKSCPENSITAQTGSTSGNDCICKEGYKEDSNAGYKCKAINCPQLTPPPNGRLFECRSSQVGDSCSVKCDDTYCPFSLTENRCLMQSRGPSRPRVCLPSGEWSGSEFKCERIKCSASDLKVEHGSYHCNSSDNYPGIRCELNCLLGFKQSKLTTKYRICLRNGTWTGVKGICEAVKCKPLKINRKFFVKPDECAVTEQPFETTCQHYCTKGFKLHRIDSHGNTLSIGERKCNMNGNWAGRFERITCRDVTPPTITCPPSQTVTTAKGQAISDFVNWPAPNASDNGLGIKIKLEYPQRAKNQQKIKQPYRFPIGQNKLVYKAVDGANLNSSCSFAINVIDNEPPKTHCPKRIEEFSPEDSAEVTWVATFADNSGKYKILHQSHKPGDKFSWGAPVEVTYEVEDPSGNKANCSFNVIVKPYECRYYRPPVKGAMVCTNTAKDNVACTVSCDEGYEFSRPPAAIYECINENGIFSWDPQLPLPGTVQKMKPWPDCSEKTGQVVNAGLQLQYFSGDCNNESTIQQLTEKFQQMLKEKLKYSTCNDPSKCKVAKFSISCKAQKKRQKRELDEDDDDNFVILVNFEIEISEETLKEIQEASNTTKENVIDSFLTNYVEDVTASNPDEENIIFDDIKIVKNATLTCQEGQVKRDESCINCPRGTFFNISTSQCEFCPVNTYQENEASLSCIPCLGGTFTVGLGSSSLAECNEFCSAGTFSEVALQPCTPCDLGFYQDLQGQTECKECPANTTTWREGATDITNCTVPCEPGHASPSGFEPCYPCPEGSYQPIPGQTQCISCPGDLLTAIEGGSSITSCEKITVCDSSPCLNEGNCTVISIDDYECTCLEGFEGTRCEINEDDCAGDLCFNNGTCVDGINDFTCECTEGFTGKQCEADIDDCHDGTCRNGGTCVDDVGSYQCICQPGYTGQHCETNINECSPNPCLNGGFCFDMENAFRCSCPIGFTGLRCEVNINDCESDPCQNNGTCTDHVATYSCTCATGFSGDNCEIMADNCESQPCQNSGICINLPNDYTCQCLPGYKGRNCNEVAPPSYDLVFSGSHSSDYVKVNVDRNLFAVTVAFWMKTTDRKNRGTPLSYAYKSPVTDVEEDNGLTFMDYSKFIIYLHGKEIRTDLVANRDSKWHHYALTWESSSGSWAIYEDSILHKDGLNISIGVPLWKGTFILGQEQDSIGGSFSPTEAFNGRITQFNVWNYALTPEEIKEISSACGYVGNVINWPSAKGSIHGEVQIQDTSEVCSDSCHAKKESCLCQFSPTELRKYCGSIVPSVPNCSNNRSSIEIGKDQFICDCGSGLQGKFCEYDINECLTNNGNCSDICINTIGSFECQCHENSILKDDNRTCHQSNYCEHNGLIYNDSETWSEKCKTCTCEMGQVTCEEEKCSKPLCKKVKNQIAELQPILLPGNCCKSCESLPENVCSVSPSNTYSAFNGKEFNFASNCRYILVHDCGKGTFSVHIQNEALRLRRKIITVYALSTQVMVNSYGKLFVNGEPQVIPYRGSDDVAVTYSKPKRSKQGKKDFVRITTIQGLSILWTSEGIVTVNAPSSLNGSLCGLCGELSDFNDNKYTTRNGLTANTLTEYLHSWKVEGKCAKPKYKVQGTPKLKVEGICKESSYALQKAARRACEILRGETFYECYQHINVQEYYDICLQDACMCGIQEGAGIKGSCQCGSILTYIQECRKEGLNITINGNENFCETYCENGTIFRLDAPICPSTCSGIEEKNQHCNTESKVPKCSCPDSKVLHEGYCIDKTECTTEEIVLDNGSLANVNLTDEVSISNESSIETNVTEIATELV